MNVSAKPTDYKMYDVSVLISGVAIYNPLSLCDNTDITSSLLPLTFYLKNSPQDFFLRGGFFAY